MDKETGTVTVKNGTIVAGQQEGLLATSFHPELAPDSRFHRYFLSLVPAVGDR